MDSSQVAFDTFTSVSGALVFLLILINVTRIKFAKLEATIILSLFMVAIKGIDFIPVNMDVRSALTHVIIILSTTLMLKRKIQIISLSIFYAVLMSIISLLAGHIVGSIIIFLFSHLSYLGTITQELVSNDWGLLFLYKVIFFPLTFFTSKLIGRFLHKQLGNLDALVKGKFLTLLMVGALLTITVFLIGVLMRDTLYELALLELVYGLSLGLCFTYFAFSLYIFSKNMQFEIEGKHLQIYSENIEGMNKELRVFRHDHFNLLLGFSGHIKNRDLVGIEQYYNNYIKILDSNLDIAALDLNLNNLMNIKIPSLKAILSYKLQNAYFSGIDVRIKPIGEISIATKNISLIDLCRMVGIFLDNAIEACVEQINNGEKAVLEFSTTSNDKYFSLQFANTFHTKPSLSKMFEEGFSTKSNGRGLGLYTVSKIVDENDALDLDSYIYDCDSNQYLIHELNVTNIK